jgi:hypothetical protein
VTNPKFLKKLSARTCYFNTIIYARELAHQILHEHQPDWHKTLRIERLDMIPYKKKNAFILRGKVAPRKRRAK